ncbi:MAG: aldo/keto reductase [Candidatus Nanohaloarchaea archaeon]
MKIPSIGLGTWQNKGPKCAKSVSTALEMGYRHIDTAQAYDNEEYVGQGIEESSVSRDDIFLASKVWNSNLSPEDVISSTRESLDKLGVESVDLMYVHWPSGEYSAKETLEAFQEMKEEGMIENIGVSNFTPELLDEALRIAPGIAANQVEMHPLLQQDELLDYCQENDIYLVAYSPLARGEVFNVPEINQVAEKHGVSEAQVSLAWLLEKENVRVIPKATSEEHIRDNLKALDLELDEEDIEKIDSIEREERMVDPGFSPDW